jgi:serine acetyltransferase
MQRFRHLRIERDFQTIGDNGHLASGAKVFGKINIGNNTRVGADAVVYEDVPDNAIVAMASEFEIISYEGNRSVDQKRWPGRPLSGRTRRMAR